MPRGRLRFGFGWLMGGGSVGVPAAPAFAWTSGTNVYNPTFTLTGIQLADVVQLQIDDDPAFGSIYGDDTNTVDATEAEDGVLTFPGIPTLGFGTTYYARTRITRGGVTGPWSSVENKAMDAAPPTIWGDVADVSRSQYISLDGTKRIATSVDTGAQMSAIANNAKRSGTRYFEVDIDPLVAFSSAGIGIGATWPPNFVNPGNSATRIWRSANGIVRSNSADLANEGSYDLATPFTMGCKVTAADDVTFYLNGVAGTTRTIPGASSWFPFVTLIRADTGALKVVAANITSMPSGATGWDD